MQLQVAKNAQMQKMHSKNCVLKIHFLYSEFHCVVTNTLNLGFMLDSIFPYEVDLIRIIITQ